MVSPTTPARFGPASRRGWLARGLVLAAALGVTAWNLTRSQALAEARSAYDRHDLKTALRRALDHLERRPWSREAHALAARCLSRLDFPDLAEPHYRALGSLALDDQNVRAYGFVRANQRERAIKAYEQILARWPDDVTALRRLAAVRMSQSQMGEALVLARRLARLPESAVLGYTMIGSIYHDTRDPEPAVAAFERVLVLDPDLRRMELARPLFWAQFAEDLLLVGQAQKARGYLERALAQHDDATLWHQLGRAHHHLAQPAEAERCWRRAVALDPTAHAAWLDLARLALERDQPAQALEALDRAAALRPDDYEALFARLSAQRRLKNAAEVRRLQARIDDLRRRHGTPASATMGAKPMPAEATSGGASPR